MIMSKKRGKTLCFVKKLRKIEKTLNILLIFC